MKIKTPERTNLTLFEDIAEGDVFEMQGAYYMKFYMSNYLNNAIDLFDGDVIHVPDDKEVYLVDCELVIK